MYKLSDFKDIEAIIAVSELIPPVMSILTNPANKSLQGKTPFEMFSGFFANTPRAMLDIFAILSKQEPGEYHCDGVDVVRNIMVLASDQRMADLFTSQEQTEAVTSSGSALENSEG